jgi:hypothetical protein
VERGEHRDLLARSREYRRLYELKIGEHPARTISMDEA